jgi:hypothetical protein
MSGVPEVDHDEWVRLREAWHTHYLSHLGTAETAIPLGGRFRLSFNAANKGELRPEGAPDIGREEPAAADPDPQGMDVEMALDPERYEIGGSSSSSCPNPPPREQRTFVNDYFRTFLHYSEDTGYSLASCSRTGTADRLIPRRFADR